MTNTPQDPNFIPGVGQLATSRYDFQKHVDGANFRHKADQIDLSPSVFGATTVQQALYTISLDLNPVIPQATSSVFGTITLSGDLGGTAADTKVVALQHIPISTLLPGVSQVLTYDGTSWRPSNPYIVPAPVIYNSSLSPVYIPPVFPSDGYAVFFGIASVPMTINLPLIGVISGSIAGRLIIIKDNTGNATAQNITIIPSGVNTIDGSTSPYIINVNYGCIELVSDGIFNWQIVSVYP